MYCTRSADGSIHCSDNPPKEVYPRQEIASNALQDEYQEKHSIATAWKLGNYLGREMAPQVASTATVAVVAALLMGNSAGDAGKLFFAVPISAAILLTQKQKEGATAKVIALAGLFLPLACIEITPVACLVAPCILYGLTTNYPHHFAGLSLAIANVDQNDILVRMTVGLLGRLLANGSKAFGKWKPINILSGGLFGTAMMVQTLVSHALNCAGHAQPVRG